MNRRQALQLLAAGAASAAVGSVARAQGRPAHTGMGLVTYALDHHRAALRRQTPPVDLADPLEFLEFCHALGAGGVQLPLGDRDEAFARRLRAKAERYGMYVEGMADLPADDSQRERFEARLRLARSAGITTARIVLLPGRRYEYFNSLDQFRGLDARARRSLERAAPLAEKHRVRLAVENHKTHLAAEQLELLRRLGSPQVGSCVDTGNNLALLEDPLEVVRTLAPTAFSVHLKDQAVREYGAGFLLGDCPLGQGALDLKQMVAVLRQAQPGVRFNLELITRAPLKVPCLTEKYWAALPAGARDNLAPTLRFVRAHAAQSLPEVESLAAPDLLRRESANIAESLTYAREHLGL
ncbi:MAG: sugar phosphate isomerase/epimerase [Thermoguttaceae bacterium]|jgi:sugar phosphate isomerase/epimerase